MSSSKRVFTYIQVLNLYSQYHTITKPHTNSVLIISAIHRRRNAKKYYSRDKVSKGTPVKQATVAAKPGKSLKSAAVKSKGRKKK